jgi:branched-chain amino acid transport system substrate-binding protein
VVPDDSKQGPATARFIAGVLKAEKLVVVDDQTAYSVPLANSVQANATDAGLTVRRESVSQSRDDFSPVVANIDVDVDAVYLPWELGANARRLSEQLAQRGRTPVIVGSDGLYSSDFLVEGAYVFSFAPDVRQITSSARAVKSFGRSFKAEWDLFGPPAYVAAEVVVRAIKAACRDGTVSRAEVAREVRRVTIGTSILGSRLAFAANGEALGSQFHVFQITAGDGCPHPPQGIR